MLRPTLIRWAHFLLALSLMFVACMYYIQSSLYVVYQTKLRCTLLVFHVTFQFILFSAEVKPTGKGRTSSSDTYTLYTSYTRTMCGCKGSQLSWLFGGYFFDNNFVMAFNVTIICMSANIFDADKCVVACRVSNASGCMLEKQSHDQICTFCLTITHISIDTRGERCASVLQ